MSHANFCRAWQVHPKRHARKIIALFVDANGNLSKYLRWFQAPDAPFLGAQL